MKKRYSAPDIVYENFSLSTSVAACAVQTNFAEGSCGYKYAPGVVLFMSGIGGCDTPIEDGSPFFDGLCYHVPIDSKEIFNS